MNRSRIVPPSRLPPEPEAPALALARELGRLIGKHLAQSQDSRDQPTRARRSNVAEGPPTGPRSENDT